MTRPRARRSRPFISKRASRFIIATAEELCRDELAGDPLALRQAALDSSVAGLPAQPSDRGGRNRRPARGHPRAGRSRRRTSRLKNYHLFDATLGEFYRRAGDLERARQCLEAAKVKTRSPHDHAIIDRRLATCS